LTVASGLALKVGTGTAYVSGGTDVAVADGGTGVSALTAHYLLVGNGTSALTLVAPSATSGVPLISQGSSSDPVYGTAVVAGGGTGITSATAYAVLCGGTTSTGAFQSVASVGSSGQALLSNGAGSTPTFQAIIPAYAAGTYATNTTISGTIPYDDTIPQIGEGTEIISISITPIRSTSKIKVSFAGQGGVASAGPMTAALFVNGGSDAVQAAVFQTTSVNTEYPCSFEYSYAPGSTSAQTIALRVGSNSGNSFMNGNSTAGRKYGGAQATTLIAQEIFQ
jgi:hypothetical protein